MSSNLKKYFCTNISAVSLCLLLIPSLSFGDSESDACEAAKEAVTEAQAVCAAKDDTIVGDTSPQKICYETVLKLAREDRDSACEEDDEVSGVSCEDIRDEFNELISMCKEIPGTKVDGTDDNLFGTCGLKVDECYDIMRSEKPREQEVKNCEWLNLKATSSEDKKKLKEMVKEKQQSLLKNVAETEIENQKLQKERAERALEVQRAIQKIQIELASIPTEINSIEMEAEYEKLQLDEDYSNQLLDLQTQLQNAKELGIFMVESEYDDSINAAKNACRVKAKARYEEDKKLLYAKLKSISGVGWSYVPKPKAQQIAVSMAKCLNDDVEYAQALQQAAKNRLAKLTAEKTKIQNLSAKISNLQTKGTRQAQLLSSSTNTKLQAIGKKQAALNQELQNLNQELAKLSSPDQSQAVAMMQQQSQSMMEYNMLLEMKDKSSLNQKYIIDRDNFKYLSQLTRLASIEDEDSLEEEGYINDFAKDYRTACKVKSRSSSRSSGLGGT